MSRVPANLELQAEADVGEVLLSDFGVPCLYRPGGGPAGVEVVAHVSTAPQAARRLGMGRHGGEAATHRAAGPSIQVAALATGEEFDPDVPFPHGASGGIVDLRDGDVFEVPARKMGGGSGRLPVVVRGGIERVGGHWHAEISR